MHQLKINKPHTRPRDERLIRYNLIKRGGCFRSDLQSALPHWRITKVVRTRPQLWQRTRTCRPLAGSQSPKRRRTGGELQEPGSPLFAFLKKNCPPPCLAYPPSGSPLLVFTPPVGPGGLFLAAGRGKFHLPESGHTSGWMP